MSNTITLSDEQMADLKAGKAITIELFKFKHEGCKSSGVLDADTGSEGLVEPGRPAALLSNL